MYLLDHIVQCREPLVVRNHSGQIWRLPGAADFATRLAQCPLRYVLADDLVRICVELAYSEGDDLSSCMDLVRFPAEQLWLEWNEPVRVTELSRALRDCAVAPATSVRGGILIAADSTGRSAVMRTFWLSRDEPREPVVGAGETLIDLDHAPPCADEVTKLLEGSAVRVRDPVNPNLDGLLHCAGFRLDPDWHRYYAVALHSEAKRDLVIARTLGSVAFDVPWVLALLMLMRLQAGLTHRAVSSARINAKRARLGRSALLDHIEVSCPLLSMAQPSASAEFDVPRQGPRLHHVRGHLVRRDDVVFWRRPHWRGHLRLGCVRSRTVKLRAY